MQCNLQGACNHVVKGDVQCLKSVNWYCAAAGHLLKLLTHRTATGRSTPCCVCKCGTHVADNPVCLLPFREELISNIKSFVKKVYGA